MQDQTGQHVQLLPSGSRTSATKQTYRVVLNQDEDGRIVARCLDLQGVVTDGATEDEAIENVYEALEAMLEAKGLEKDFNLIVIENMGA
jgi:predicted RNase H-like HicB family nuclease